MKTSTLTTFFVLLFIAVAPVTASSRNVPAEVGGFGLGTDMKDYPEVVESNYLKETVITDWHGFRKGIISVGVCKHTDIILRIRLKYEDSSKKFFKKLLAEYKKSFGPPDEWKGDSFGILHVWRWNFVDSENRRVTLLLQHNLKNTNENIGNQVKLSFPDLLREERECFNQFCEDMKSDKDKQRLEELKKPDWQFMIPR